MHAICIKINPTSSFYNNDYDNKWLKFIYLTVVKIAGLCVIKHRKYLNIKIIWQNDKTMHLFALCKEIQKISTFQWL